MTIHEKLLAIQTSLKARKNQHNKFGGYNYRSCEDILEALKPLLNEHGLVLTLSDRVVEVGGRIYVQATATVAYAVNPTDKDYSSIGVFGFAREAETKKGMDDAQITGAASSYARKCALNGLFCIDDTKDADTMDNSAAGTTNTPASPKKDAGELATEKQRSFIASLAKEKGADLEEYKQKHGITNLTKVQASALIEHLEKLSRPSEDLPFAGSTASKEQMDTINELALETDYNVMEYCQRMGIDGDFTKEQAVKLITYLTNKKADIDKKA